MRKTKLIIIISGIYIFWLCILPSLFTNTVKILCKNFSYNSAYRIEIKNPHTRFSFLPVGIFKADEINISAKNGSSKLKFEKFHITIRLLPLLSGKIHINELKSSSVDVMANMGRQIEFDKDFFEKLKNTNLRCDSLEINNHTINLFLPEVCYPVTFSGNRCLYHKKYNCVKLILDSRFYFGKNHSAIALNLFLPKNNDIDKTVFDIKIETLDMGLLQRYLKHYLPSDLVTMRGKVDIYANKYEFVTELNNCALIRKDTAKSIVFPQYMNIKSKFHISKKTINFENIDIESKNMHVSMSGKIIDYCSKTMPSVFLNLRINKSKIEDFINILVPFKVEEIDVYKLKKYKFYGDILANLTIKGRLPEPEIYGDIYIDNGILIKAIPNTSKGASIKLKLTGKNIKFDVSVPAGGTEKVCVQGSQELYNTKFADMIIKSTSSVDLKIAQNVLNPLHEILNFVIGPVPVMDIYGKGNIDIHFKGNRKNPHIWGVFNVKKGNVCFNEIPNLWLKNADAVLKFNNQEAFFTSENGFVNGKLFSINGVCNLLGKFDFNVKSYNQSMSDLYTAIITSSMLHDFHKNISQLYAVNGLADLVIELYGNVKYIEDLKLNQNAFVKGNILLKNSDFIFKNMKISQTNAIVEFDSNFVKAEIKAYLAKQPLEIKASIKKKFAELSLNIPSFNLNSILMKNKQSFNLPYVSINGTYSGFVNNIDFNRLNIEAKVLGSDKNSDIKFLQNGIVKITNNKVFVKNLNGYILDKQNTFAINLNINDAFEKKPDINGNIRFKADDVSSLNSLLVSNLLPENIRQYTKNYDFRQGRLNFNTKITNNKPEFDTSLAGINLIYLPLNMPIEIINGTLSGKNNILKFNKINVLADKMPILLDGEVKDILDKRHFNLYINSKPRQDFIEKYINKNQIYPIKIKGDILYWVKLKGVPNNYDLKAKMSMSKDSSVYHFGATVGDVENAIELSLESEVKRGNHHKIKEFSYDKIIDSQNGRQSKLNLLKANGKVEILKDDLVFDNLTIKTSNPTDARIFNIIFRKPNLKQGLFTSDLKFDGKLSNPKVLGNFHIFEADLPFFDTIMKNIELVFKDKTIEIKSKGEIIGNAITFEGVLQNKLTTPYKIEKACLYTKDLDLNQIINKLKVAEMENISPIESIEGINLKSIIAKDFKLKANSIRLRNIQATDFEAITNLSAKGIFDVNKFKFNIANGTLEGDYTYNLANQATSLNLTADSIDANDITIALFDLDNQIFGDLTGNVHLSCNGENYQKCMETLSGKTIFNVKDGRMPKLGSLEYLLKAGNLVKGGFTGLSINSVIDLITPLKTGDFSDIYGFITIHDGKADTIEIATKGKDLSLFINGTYNFANSYADMEVLGLLSRKISTIFGPLGNISINTLFNVIPGIDLTKNSPVIERINKIPGIELSNKTYRKLIAEIRGNIKGDNYVKSFQWIN